MKVIFFLVSSIRVVSLYQNIQPGLSGLLYQYQKDIALISRPLIRDFFKFNTNAKKAFNLG